MVYFIKFKKIESFPPRSLWYILHASLSKLKSVNRRARVKLKTDSTLFIGRYFEK